MWARTLPGERGPSPRRQSQKQAQDDVTLNREEVGVGVVQRRISLRCDLTVAKNRPSGARYRASPSARLSYNAAKESRAYTVFCIPAAFRPNVRLGSQTEVGV